jgi:hypothetical protein
MIGQGDRLSGQITRFTLGQVVLDAVKAEKIPNKVTFECTECTK